MIAARLDPLIGGDLNSILPAGRRKGTHRCEEQNRKLEGRKNNSGAPGFRPAIPRTKSWMLERGMPFQRLPGPLRKTKTS